MCIIPASLPLSIPVYISDKTGLGCQFHTVCTQGC